MFVVWRGIILMIPLLGHVPNLEIVFFMKNLTEKIGRSCLQCGRSPSWSDRRLQSDRDPSWADLESTFFWIVDFSVYGSKIKKKTRLIQVLLGSKNCSRVKQVMTVFSIMRAPTSYHAGVFGRMFETDSYLFGRMHGRLQICPPLAQWISIKKHEQTHLRSKNSFNHQ